MQRSSTDVRQRAQQSSAPRVEMQLEAVAERLPAMHKALKDHGQRSLRAYVATLTQPKRPDSLQGHADLVERVHRQCTELLDDNTAERAAESLQRSGSVLTANHHGVDFFAQSVQGTLALALSEPAHENAAVVLACGAVPMNNLTYPRGMLSYLEPCAGSKGLPIKLPLFPDRFKRTLVCTAPAFDASMVERAVKRLSTMVGSNKLAPSVARIMQEILQDDYGAQRTLALENYSQQATFLNHRLWTRMFAQRDAAPGLAYLELEAITTDLLCEDLNNDSSLAHAVAFHSDLREQVLWRLDGERACWNRSALARRNLASGADRAAAGATGTVLFWGLDAKQRRIPLTLTGDGAGKTHLVGVSDDSEQFRLSFDAASVTDALKSARLLPSLFMSYLTIAMARGIRCLGGYYQAEYLPTMQDAVVNALRDGSGNDEEARRVGAVKTDAYLSGMQAVCTLNSDGGLMPAGPLEIIAAGGLDKVDLDKIANLSVRDAHLASITDTLMDAGRDLVGTDDWHADVARELTAALGERVLVTAVES